MQYIFRGLTADNQWVYGSLIQRVDGIGKLSLIEVQVKDGEIKVWQVKDDSVGMWTGMNDKIGARIFDGDIIRFAEKYKYLVRYENAKFVGYHANNDWGKWGDLFHLCDPPFNEYNYIIIGNKHDNPELLNPTK